MSSTTAKALSLLNSFSEHEANLGLSELARRTSYDKATVHRLLSTLSEFGLLEQDIDSKLYRLGPEIIRLARIRENSFPVNTIIDPVLTQLSTATGETAHATIISAQSLVTIGISASLKTIRVSLEAGQTLSWHGTASGIITLAYNNVDFINRMLEAEFTQHTQNTLTDRNQLLNAIRQAKENGFYAANQTFEDDVVGLATPYFDAYGNALGAIAVATPAHRMNAALRHTILKQLMGASMDISRKMGALPANDFVQCANKLLADSTD